MIKLNMFFISLFLMPSFRPLLAFPQVQMIQNEVPYNKVECLGANKCTVTDVPQFEKTEIFLRENSPPRVESLDAAIDVQRMIELLSERTRLVLSRSYLAYRQIQDMNLATRIPSEVFSNLEQELPSIRWTPLLVRPKFNGEERDFAVLRWADGTATVGFYIPSVQLWLSKKQNFDAILLHEAILLQELQGQKNISDEQQYSLSAVIMSWMKLGRMSRVPYILTGSHMDIWLTPIGTRQYPSYKTWIKLRLPLALPQSATNQNGESPTCANVLGPSWSNFKGQYDTTRERRGEEWVIANMRDRKPQYERSEKSLREVRPGYAPMYCVKLFDDIAGNEDFDSDGDGVLDFVDRCVDEPSSAVDNINSFLSNGRSLGCPNGNETLGTFGGIFCRSLGRCYER